MASEENLCSPLLERIRKLQEKRQQCRLKSSDVILNAHLPSKDDASPRESDCVRSSGSCYALSPNVSQDMLSIPDSSKQEASSVGEGSCDKDDGSSKQQDIGEVDIKASSLHSEDSLNHEFHEFSLTPSEKTPVKKFPYLRKGQGTARYRTKVLKGFKKKGSKSKSDSDLKVALSSNSNHLVDLDGQQEEVSMDVGQKESAFEKLESLIEHESFCSTSSQVIELLQDDSHCSSPLLRKGPLPLLPLTPIPKINLKKEQSHAQDFDDRHINKTSHTGILRKGYPSLVSPSDLKVQFLEQGVEVLEYDEGDHEQDLTANDSDLINVSDLENLALLNFNVNVVHKDSRCNKPSLSQYYPMVRTTGAIDTQSPSNLTEENIVSQSQTSGMQLSRDTSTTPAPSRAAISSDGVNNTGKSSFSRIPKVSQLNTQEEDLEVKSHKLLLLSKVNDLSKEIEIFKQKNSTLEKLVEELQKEKQNLNEKYLVERSEPVRKVENPRPRRKNMENFKNQASSDVMVIKKLQNLSEKLLKLEIENKNLKRKLNGLEKKEKEAKKNLSEPLPEITNNAKENVETTSQGFVRQRVMFQRTKIAPKTKTAPQHLETVRKTTSCRPKVTSQVLSEKENTPSSSSPKSMSFNVRKGQSEEILCEPSCQENYIAATEEPVALTFATNITANKHSIFPSEDEKIPFVENNERNLPLKDSNIQRIPTSTCNLFYEGYPDDNIVVANPISIDQDSLRIVDVHPKDAADLGTEATTDGSVVSVSRYPNGDKKIVFADKTVIEYVKDGVIHTAFHDDGREEISFANGQREIYFKDGSYQLIFPDNSSKSVYRDGTEVCVWKDGTVIQLNKDGTKNVHFPNGQKEIYEEGRVQRVYPDGTIKILHSDGSQETRYPNGRVRFKDRDGKVTSRRLLTAEM